jgi:pyruvate kinase
MPIILVTRNAQTARQSHLHRGIFPFVYEGDKDANWQLDVEARIRHGIDQGKKHGLLRSNEPIVIVQGWKGGLGNTNTIRVLIAP